MSDLSFEARADGVYLVGEAPAEVLLTKELLLELNDQWRLSGDDVVTFSAVNGEWRYRIVEEAANHVRAELISARPGAAQRPAEGGNPNAPDSSEVSGV
jgi:hypothetical protein